ncbi:hypothetical protein [Mycobacterium sp.]|uniref:hypothetical protein n=1 Tax=Mycobacterium sp. TaxID=1785 RepID=UPI003D6C1F28
MSETPEPSVPPAPATPPPAVAAPPSNPGRLYRAAAWVAIVAGILFIAVTIVWFICVLACWQ